MSIHEPRSFRRAIGALAFVAASATAAALLGPPAALAFEANYEGSSGSGDAAFFSTNQKLVPGDTDNRRDIYVRSFDEAIGSYVTREVSTGPTGGNDAFDAIFEKASADGARVFFSTSESLVPADTDRSNDVYMREVSKGTTTLVSQGAAACQPGCGNGPATAGFASATADGTEAFFSTDEQLEPAADGDGSVDVYMRDLSSGTTSLVSAGAPACGPGCGNGEFTATLRGVSADGTRAFFATFEQLTGADTDLAGDTYARDLPGGPTELVTQGDPSCAPCGSSDSANAGFAGSSSDGSKVFFETSESLVPADADEANDVYRRSAGVTTLVSDGSQEQPANLSAASADGSKAFFVTAEPLLVADKNAATDVYIWHGGARELVTSGECCDSTFGASTADGASVVFITSEQLSGVDTDSSPDVYEQEVGGGAPNLVSDGAASCAPACGNGEAAAIFSGISSDGSRVFFTTEEQLAPGDTDTNADIYVHDLNTSVTELVSIPGVSCPSAGGCDALFDKASGGGDHVFFQTTERMTEGDVDSEPDVYERAGGQTRLVSTGNSVNLGPATPVLERTSPDSPNASTTPAIIGQSDPNTSIKIYFTQDCSGEVAAIGTGVLLGGVGIQVTVPAGSTTSFRATATDENGDTSGCSGPIAYKQGVPPPPPPPPEEPPIPPGGGSGSGGTAGSGGSPGGSGRSGGGSGQGGGSKQGDGPGHTTPHTQITFAPLGKTRVRRPVFRFTDSTEQAGTTFSCKVDGHAWQGCGSPTKLRRLSLGRHVFEVRATNAVGSSEPQPVTRRFKVVRG